MKRNPFSKELDGYFQLILVICREFMTLHAYKVLYKELREALPITEVSKVRIVEHKQDGVSRLCPAFNPFNEDQV